MPTYLNSDHDPLYRFHQWQANLRILDVTEIKTVPYVPLSHPFVERLICLLPCRRVRSENQTRLTFAGRFAAESVTVSIRQRQVLVALSERRVSSGLGARVILVLTPRSNICMIQTIV